MKLDIFILSLIIYMNIENSITIDIIMKWKMLINERNVRQLILVK